jgi:dTDP-4-amino-4,6-dideoxygalactose transaminase
MLTTNDPDLAARLSTLRVHGRTGTYIHERIGINSRLDALQAAVLHVKLRYLDAWTEGRQRNAQRYRQKLDELGSPVTTPIPAPYQSRHIYNQFVIRCDQRDALREYLKQQGIGSEVYYPLPLHLQPCYRDLGYHEGAFPVAEESAKNSVALPVQGEISLEDVDYISERIAAFYSL